MRFGVLGPVTAWTDSGESVTVPGLKVRALLADLLVHEGRPVPADRLIDDLWGEALPGHPAGTLSAKVSQLRRALEDAEPGSRSLVVSGPAGYSIKVDEGSCDALRFQALLTGERADLAAALGLWRGPAYADFADEGFTETAIARLSEQRLTAQEDQVEARLALGEHRRLVGELGDLLAEHPLRERLRAAQLTALYRSGRQSEALQSYEQWRVLLADELGLDPGPELTALHQAILRQDPSLESPGRPGPSPRRRTNLPAQLTDLIGRDEAIAELTGALYDDRLVTLTGPGGVGKTRLAIATAAGLADEYSDGVALVELAAVDPEAADLLGSLTDAVQAALDLRDAAGPGEELDRLGAALAERELLLVLDNCEHLVVHAAELTDRLLAAAPGLRVLATSREPLGLAGEVVWNVPTLEVPGLAADVSASRAASAVQLFVARAAAADRTFTLDEETAPAVAVLCRRLDGIPFALELAATRVRALGVHGLVARLDDRFRLLATGHRGAAPRQQTLMAMIDWSWELLTVPEQLVLRRLAVHADGCTADAAEQVCSGEDLPAADVLDVLMRLVDRSLVVPVPGADGPRFRLLESVAAYCVEKLHQASEFEQVRRRHHGYYTEFAERARPDLYGHEQKDWLLRLDDDAGNLRSALDGAVADRDSELALRLVDALAWYWFLRGRLTEGRRSIELAFALSNESSAVPRARVAAWRAGFAYLQGDTAAAALRDTATTQYAEVDDGAARARAEWFLAFVGSDAGDLSTGMVLLDRCLATFEASNDQWGVAAVLVARAKHAHVRGDLVALEKDARESARLFRELRDHWGLLQATGWLGGLAELSGDYRRATDLHLDGLRLAENLGLWPEVAGELGWLGWTAVRQGEYRQAREYSEQALRLATEQGYRASQVLAEIVLGFAARRTGDLDLAEKQLRALIDAARQQDGPALHLSMVLQELGYALELRGDLEASRTVHEEGFRASREHASQQGMVWALEGLAGTLRERPEVAARLLGVAHTVRAAEGLLVTPAEGEDVVRIAAAVRATLGPARFSAEFDRGRNLTLDEAFALVG